MTDVGDDSILRWHELDRLDDETRRALFGPDAPFEIRVEEVHGAPCEVFPNAPASVCALIESGADKGDLPFLVSDVGAMTYAELPSVLGAVVAELRHRGVTPGDPVLYVADTTDTSLRTLLGVVATGAVVVPLNPRWGPAELSSACEIINAKLALVDDNTRERLADLGVTTALIDDVASAASTREPEPLHAPTPDDPFAIIFTSGTTGRAKGATLTHRNATHFCHSVAATALVHGVVSGAGSRSGAQPTVIASAPMFHMSGLLGQLVSALAFGMRLVVEPGGRWDPETHLRLTEQFGVTQWSLVPTQLKRIVDHPKLSETDLSSLSSIGGGGATFAPELLRTVQARIPQAETGIRIGYGSTETAGTISLLMPPVSDDERRSVGRPVAGAQIQIRDPLGEPLPPGEIGMIWARSSTVFLGYWNDERATADCFDAERWYSTGDFGRVAGGLLFLESRERDMIIRGGENIYPIEIENRLVEHPAIEVAAVVGRDDADLGQVVRAVVVCSPEAKLTAHEVRDWVGEALARFKVPTDVEFRDELPMSDVGKVLKREL